MMHARRADGRDASSWRTPLALMTTGVLAMLLAAPAPAQLVLPSPGGNPQAIDFVADPLLVFLARPVPAEAFRAAVAAAVTSYPTWGEGIAGAEAAAAARRTTRSALFPGFDASLVASRSLARDFEGNSAIVESLIPRGRIDAAVAADQLIWDFGATGGRVAGASARVRAAIADAGESATATSLAVITTWYQAAGLRALLDVSDALVARHRSILDDTRIRMAAGLGTGGDVARAEAGLADAIGAASRTERSLAAVRARYRELFGSEPEAAPAWPERPATSAGGPEAAAVMSRHQPAVVAALALAEALKAEARGVRGDALPRLSGGIAATRYNVFDSGSNYDVRGQLVLRQRFSFGGAESARVAEANARARAAAFASERVAAGAARDAEAAFDDARLLDGAVPVLADAYRANRRARDGVAEQFRLSRGALTDLLRAEQDYFAAGQALLQVSIERDIARYTLLARTGELLPLLGVPVEPRKG